MKEISTILALTTFCLSILMVGVGLGECNSTTVFAGLVLLSGLLIGLPTKNNTI